MLPRNASIKFIKVRFNTDNPDDRKIYEMLNGIKEFGSVSLGMDEDSFGEVMANIGDDFALIEALRKLYDWAVLVDVLAECNTISEAKVKTYEQHKKDLALLKPFARKYLDSKGYDSIFRTIGKDNYPAYVYHTDEKHTEKFKKKNVEDFSKFVLNTFKDVVPNDCDLAAFENMKAHLGLRTFLPKQKTTDNRVIPHQLYWYELKRILDNAQNYLVFLAEKDDSGLSVQDKIDAKYSHLSDADKKYILNLKIKDFGRLSAKLLNGIEGVQKKTGEVMTVIGAMWNTQDNLMEILADRDH